MACLQCCTPDQWCREKGSTNPQCADVIAEPASSLLQPVASATHSHDEVVHRSDSDAADSSVARAPDRILPVEVPPETAFRASDTDNNGYLSRDEVVTGLTVLNGGQAPNATFVSSLDTSGDNRISWDEFKTALETGTAAETLLPCEDSVNGCEGWGNVPYCPACLPPIHLQQ